MARTATAWRKNVAGEIQPQRVRVLLAEDDEDLRHFLAKTLARDGYAIIEVPDGSALLEYLGTVHLREGCTEPIDLIVADVQMPGFTGLQVLHGIRRSDWFTPVILITGYGTEAVQEEARRLGALALLNKPFDVDDLRTAILNALPTSPGSDGRSGTDSPRH